MACGDAGLVSHPSAILEGGSPMFDIHCTACEKRRLIFPSQVSSVVNTEHGIVVTLDCWCGAEQKLRTGKGAARAENITLAA